VEKKRGFFVLKPEFLYIFKLQELNYILPQHLYVILLSAPTFPYSWHRVVKQADNQVPDYEPHTGITFVAGEGERR